MLFLRLNLVSFDLLGNIVQFILKGEKEEKLLKLNYPLTL